MAKNYGNKRSSRHGGNVSKHILMALVCFLSGYLSASFFDFTTLIGWINAELLAGQTVQAPTKPVNAAAQLPKPKFEFYTLLASDTRQPVAPQPVSSPHTAIEVTKPIEAAALKAATTFVPPVVAAKPIPMQEIATKGSYLVQIASFRSRQDAERIKASLTLKGFSVSIATVAQQKTNWYRVVIGPFASRAEAQKAQLSVARTERITGMIRKMDA